MKFRELEVLTLTLEIDFHVDELDCVFRIFVGIVFPEIESIIPVIVIDVDAVAEAFSGSERTGKLSSKVNIVFAVQTENIWMVDKNPDCLSCALETNFALNVLALLHKVEGDVD